MEDKVVLKYTDIVLRDSDLDTLREPCFLNDQIIAFYFSYLCSSSKTDDILLVKPSVSVCLADCKDDKFVEDFAKSSNLSSKRLVLFPVHDNNESGGSHWSTLVYDRMKNLFMHYDSMQELNSFHAMKLYDAVKEYMGPGGSEVSRAQISSPSLKKQKNKKKKRVQSGVSKPVEDTKSESVAATGPAVLPKYMECETHQQSNGYDCGLYVLAIAREICRWRSNQKGDMISAIQKQVDDSVEVNMRSEVLDNIQQLAEY